MVLSSARHGRRAAAGVRILGYNVPMYVLGSKSEETDIKIRPMWSADVEYIELAEIEEEFSLSNR